MIEYLAGENVIPGKYYECGFLKAASMGNLPMLKVFHRNAANNDLNIDNATLPKYQDRNALMLAIVNGYTPLAQHLIKYYKININAIDDYGNTALMLAVFTGNVPLVQQLLAVPGINVNIQEYKRGWSALFMAVHLGMRNRELAHEMVKLLISHPELNKLLKGKYDTTL